MEILENKTTKDKQDSLWFGGNFDPIDDVVMRVKYKNREWSLVACGEIKIDHKELGRVLPEEVANTDEELYKLLLKHFKLDLIKNNEIYKYHGFRNDVIDLFIKESEQ